MALSTESEPPNILRFKSWLSTNGAYFHPDVRFVPGPYGSVIVAANALPPHSTIVSCPFALAITPEISKKALTTLLGDTSITELEGWSERQVICSYICMHWVLGESSSNILGHFQYLDTLPSLDMLRTPLYFTPTELEAFRGTNLYGATLDRRQDWDAEWSVCRKYVSSVNAKWVEEFTWERYLRASTYLSSRGFPSTLLSPAPTLTPTLSSHPVLLPGVDSLNHARGQPVSWVVSYPCSNDTKVLTEPTISLLLHPPADAGHELFNNYGAKPNSELILGYGFSLPNNPDDTIILKIGSSHNNQTRKWELGRHGKGVEGFWEEVLHLMTQGIAPEDCKDDTGFENELDAADFLLEMVQDLLQRLPSGWENLDLRAEVKDMLAHYVEGQRDILEFIIKFAEDKERDAIEKAG